MASVFKGHEDKHSPSFKVFQSFSEGALATEISNKQYGWYNGNTVLLLGEMYYDGQIIKMKAPMQVGIYRYETKNGDMKTVPVIKQILTEKVIEQKDTGRKARRRAKKANVNEEEWNSKILYKMRKVVAMSNDFSVNSPIKNQDSPFDQQHLWTLIYKNYNSLCQNDINKCIDKIGKILG